MNAWSMSNALSSGPVAERCRRVTKFLEDTKDNLTIYNNLNFILASIFGQDTDSWFEASKYSEIDRQALFKLLEPQGNFVQTLLRLDRAENYFYEIRTSFLPQSTQQLIYRSEFSSLPSFYRCERTSASQTSITMNIFTYFMFFFAQYAASATSKPTVAHHQTQSGTGHQLANSQGLLHRAVQPVFALVNREDQVDIKTETFLHLVSAYAKYFIPIQESPDGRTENQPANSERSSMFAERKHAEIKGASLADTIVELLCEVWLKPFWAGQIQPPMLLLEALFALVGHLRRDTTPPSASTGQTRYTKIMQRPVYRFLDHVFTIVSRDKLSVVSDVWLEYIRPPVDALRRYGSAWPSAADRGNWELFIASNMLFYTKILYRFLKALQTFPLANDDDAGMLERFVYQFRKPELPVPIICECERQLESGSGRFLQAIRDHICQVEGAGFEYASILHGDSTARRTFLEALHSILSTVREKCDDAERSARSFATSSDFSFLQSKSQSGLTSGFSSASIDILKSCDTYLKNVFGDPAELLALAQFPTKLQAQTPIRRRTKRNDDVVAFTSPLTVKYRGSEAEKPITSFENAFLVRFMYKIALTLNDKFDTDSFFALRAVADYRNLATMCIVSFLLYLIVCLWLK